MCKSLERLAQEELESYMATEIGLSFSHRKSETADSNKLGEAICLTSTYIININKALWRPIPRRYSRAQYGPLAQPRCQAMRTQHRPRACA